MTSLSRGMLGKCGPTKNGLIMKRWGKIDREGYRVNVLPIRKSILEHISDVRNHKCLLSGDSLPMHVALGSGVRCVSLFNCTSPWEIYDYGIQEKNYISSSSKIFL